MSRLGPAAAISLVGLLVAGVLLLHHWKSSSSNTFADADPLPAVLPTVTGEHWSSVTVDRATIWTNNDSCLACHPGHASDWLGNDTQRSLHYLSFMDSWYRQQARTQGGDFDCLACHMAPPVYEHPLGTVPPHRKFKIETVTVDGRQMLKPLPGVTCITCHVKGKSVMATRSIPNAPCNPVAEATLSTSEQCHGCHMAYGKVNTKHEYDEWLLRKPANKDVHCQDCHMETIKRPVALGLKPRTTTRHGFHVLDNPDIFNRFFSARIEKKTGGGHELVLENKGTAHGFPTGYTVKSVVVRLRTGLNTEDGAETLFRYEIRKASPFGGESTQLQDFEVRRIPLPDISAFDLITLDCLYKPYLNILDAEVSSFFESTYSPKNDK